MPNRNEKIVMTYLAKVCVGSKTHLVSPQDIALASNKKAVLSVAEIDEIMTGLSLENYIDFVVSDSKNGYYYCVTLKKKGQNFLEESKRQRKTLGLLVIRSMFLATVSFIFGLILKAIFK